MRIHMVYTKILLKNAVLQLFELYGTLCIYAFHDNNLSEQPNVVTHFLNHVINAENYEHSSVSVKCFYF